MESPGTFKRPPGSFRAVLWAGSRWPEVLGVAAPIAALWRLHRACASSAQLARRGRGLNLVVDSDADNVLLTRHAVKPRLQCGCAAQHAWCPTGSRAGALEGGGGTSPRWLSIFSISGRSRMAATILSSPQPQFGQCCMSMSNTRLSNRAYFFN